MQSTNFVQLIKENIISLQQEKIKYEEIYTNDELAGKNEFLFFIKPEMTIPSSDLEVEKIISLLLNKIAEFNLNIVNIKAISAKYLDEYNIIAQHYGIINQLANNANKYLSDEARLNIKKIYGKDFKNEEIKGALELMHEYPHLTLKDISTIWLTEDWKKLAGGTYSVRSKFENNEILMINGFHPKQLKHFVNKGRSIITLTLRGDIDWSVARNDFIGKTDPDNAKKNSIRHDLLIRKEELGLFEVTPSYNGIHLSAGPVEALIELMRYNSDLSKQKELTFDEFAFGRELKRHFSKKQIELILGNVDVKYQGKIISIFDLTEEKNSMESIEILKEVYSDSAQ